jgi:hypothetical protein
MQPAEVDRFQVLNRCPTRVVLANHTRREIHRLVTDSATITVTIPQRIRVNALIETLRLGKPLTPAVRVLNSKRNALRLVPLITLRLVLADRLTIPAPVLPRLLILNLGVIAIPLPLIPTKTHLAARNPPSNPALIDVKLLERLPLTTTTARLSAVIENLRRRLTAPRG